MIRLVTLFSGSKGNCTLAMSDTTNILIDAGLQPKRILQALSTLGLSACDIDGIIVTHEHGDHIGSLARWCKSYNTPVYAHSNLVQCLAEMCSGRLVPFVGQFLVGDIVVSPLLCSHDSVHCNGYKLTVGSTSIGIVTDTGVMLADTLEQLCSCRTVLLESNHDLDMLARGRYSYVLKRRISSNKGHLSNNQAGQVIAKLLCGNVVNIVLGHLSENNNTHELAFASAMSAITSSGRVEGRDVYLYIAEQYTRGDIIE